MNIDAIRSSIQSLQAIYSLFLALATGEAFKQFVADTATDERSRKLHLDRLINLVPFLVLIIPFFHGMNRYLYDVYIIAPKPSYGWHLLIDCLVFTIEGSIFFVLSRSLPHVQWRRFYLAVAILLALDAAWGGIVWLLHSVVIFQWVLVNLLTIPVILIIRWRIKSEDSWAGAVLCMLAVVVRSALDYALSWSFYFPS